MCTSMIIWAFKKYKMAISQETSFFNPNILNVVCPGYLTCLKFHLAICPGLCTFMKNHPKKFRILSAYIAEGHVICFYNGILPKIQRIFGGETVFALTFNEMH